MSNQSKGRKISKFIKQTSIPANAKLTHISNNTNYQIDIEDFESSIGVTGTIEQAGNVLGTPILNKAGSVNKIRNLEDGSGIKSSVSPENGVTLEHNITQDTTGAKIFKDLTALQLAVRSIVGSAGINVSESNGTIQIALSAAPVSTKTVIVNDINDFPAAVGGVITLDDNTEYAVRNDITTANRFVMGNNCVISGSDSRVVAITYTDTGDMFTSPSKSWTIKNIAMNFSSGVFLNFTGTGVEIFQILSTVLTGDTLGSISDFAGSHFDDTQQIVTTTGFTFSGTNGVILLESNLSSIDAGVLYDLGSATFTGFSVTDAFVTLNGTAKFLKGLASSGNITAGNLGSIHNCRFYGTGTALDTIASGDTRWAFHINDDISDTHQDCLISLVGNLTATTITAVNTPALIAGTWTPEHQQQFTGDANGRMTYNGVKDEHFDVTCSFSVEPVSGTNKLIGLYVAKNGTEISNSEATANVSSGSPQRVTTIWRLSLSPGDYIEAFVENETDATNILVSDAVQRVS